MYMHCVLFVNDLLQVKLILHVHVCSFDKILSISCQLHPLICYGMTNVIN